MTTKHATLSDVVAERVVRIRKRRDMTRDQLAQRCAELGYPALTAPALANVETGRRLPDGTRRRDITVDEIAVLAAALDVPPVLLMFPLGETGTSEVLPGKPVETWAAIRWFSGDTYGDELPARFPDATQSLISDPRDWNSAAAPIHLFRQHDHLLGAYFEVRIEKLFSPNSDDPGRDKALAEATALIFRIREVRAEMRRHGLTPPELDEDERHIDERRHVYLTPEQADAYATANPGELKFADWAALRATRDVKPGDGARIREAQEFARNFDLEAASGDAPDGGDDDS